MNQEKVHQKHKAEKTQKRQQKKQGKRSYSSFIQAINFNSKFINDLDTSYIISKTELKKDIYFLPRTKDLKKIEIYAFGYYFLFTNKKYKNMKPFTVDLTETLIQQYKYLSLSAIKEKLNKKIRSNLKYQLKKIDPSISLPKIAYILEYKPTKDRINRYDLGTHAHGLIEVFDNPEINKAIQQAIKQACSSCRNEYDNSQYKSILAKRDDYDYTKKGPKGWLSYGNKGKGSASGLYIDDVLLREIKAAYEEEIYKPYLQAIKKLRKAGYVIKYKRYIAEPYTRSPEKQKEIEAHMTHVCPLCGEILIVKKGKYGPFLGCSGYPICCYSISCDNDEGLDW